LSSSNKKEVQQDMVHASSDFKSGENFSFKEQWWGKKSIKEGD